LTFARFSNGLVPILWCIRAEWKFQERPVWACLV